ncbi:peptidase MA family metallohydrolase [Chloroflexus sp.]|uniref:peptidase MA family metallohydrolase n=1 Tax=Chloroflexus sp. TaxID=1904827 RepID=UPI002ACD5D68|nr:hypothetical protein [Chloroflexus sp.]
MMIRLRIWPILLGILLALATISTLLAQPQWIEQRTTYFRIIYTPSDALIADQYAAIIDSIYDELSTTFALQPTPPLTLRLYPTSESYFTANPAARNVPGVIAHADFRRREVVVIVERARRQSEPAQINNLRHELTHIFAAELSNGRLNVGLQEGIAQYMELPGPDRDDKIAILRDLTQRGELWTWAVLDDRNAIYGQPELSYPQTWSIVTFLIERDGFEQFRRLLTALPQSSGYRSAMATIYGVSATTLEREWRTWLPAFLQLEPAALPPAVIDLAPAQALLTAGDYDRALRELERLDAIADAETQNRIAALQARAQIGQRANQLTEAARTALLNGEYEQAERLIGQAEQAYREINDNRQATVLAEYRARVARGLQAGEALRRADAQARRFDIFSAQANAEAAAREFAALGDEVRRDNALALRRSLAEQQRTLAAALLFFGAAGLAIRLIGRQLWPAPEAW